MRLREIAHARGGDKGNSANIGVFPYDDKDYEYLKETLTESRVGDFFSEICLGGVDRYELDNVCGLNFVLNDVIHEGSRLTLSIDESGRSLAMILLDMEI